MVYEVTATICPDVSGMPNRALTFLCQWLLHAVKKADAIQQKFN